ncbi:M16B subfamily protease [Apilactobacillus ozensis DSM 23829 = JCM 17196]|uniref:M16B subfamily protease n=1 Tax=Apilactobacillus ozensis DSM 23829 = JCM 17196 TaxID=1423781 RepID=A0A0R2APZ3_9LACO|nr:pitrilysin family protein [Apilactobacillus ozensis]KRM68698.1 M16B subfamily protease [Apilactobacillus ozensis DSM 23829 = JCM 17196]
MKEQLSHGVELYMTPTKKFKTVTLTCNLITEANFKNFAKRAVLAELLETNNSKYKTQEELAKQLSKMYGASFGTNIVRYGNLHIIKIILSFPNANYLPNKYDNINEAIEFLMDVLLRPNVKNKAFDNKTFTTQKQNILKYLSSISDDKQYYAAVKSKELFFNENVNRGRLIFGESSQYKDLNEKNIFEYYTNTILNDNIIFSIIGDFNPHDILNVFKNYNFDDRNNIYKLLPYKHALTDSINEKTETQELSQGKLNLGYSLPINYNDKNLYAAIIFNAVFGGTPQSKLFKIVREKYSLAYYASSSFNAINGFINVQSGIDSKDKSKVISLINEQLASIQSGNFETELINHIKHELVNARLNLLDSPRKMLEQQFVNNLLGRSISFEDWQRNILAVQKEDIISVAKLVKLQSIFFLEGKK